MSVAASTREELAAYHAEIWSRCGLLAAVLGATALGVVPVWLLLVANVVAYPGVYLRIHDLGHGSPPRRLRGVARFVPVSNPIWGGTRVFADIHRLHHKYLGTDLDPWLPYYTGHPLRALFFNFIELEYTLCQFIRRRGVDRELVRNLGFNAASLVLGIALLGWLYVAHVLCQRVVHMVGIFFFNFYTHRESLTARAPIGVWCREENLRGALPLLRAIWGRDTIDGLIYHNRHHCLGQMHVPVQRYALLEDTREFSRLQRTWPVAEVVVLEASVVGGPAR